MGLFATPSRVDVSKETMVHVGMALNQHCSRWNLRVNRRDIAFLKFILEGYDGLTQLTTVDASAGKLVLLIAPGCEATARALLDDLKKEMMMEIDAACAV